MPADLTLRRLRRGAYTVEIWPENATGWQPDGVFVRWRHARDAARLRAIGGTPARIQRTVYSTGIR